MSKRSRGGSLKSQLNHAISAHLALGQSKQQMRGIYGTLSEKIFSAKSADTLRATSNQFASWMRDNHGDIKKVRDIRTEHVQHFLDSHERIWSAKTRLDKLSDLRSIFRKCEDLYHGLRCHPERLTASKIDSKIRDKAIDREDIEKLLESYQRRGAWDASGRYALELTSRLGIRSDELARSENRSDSIDIDKRVVHIVGKNGKWRDIPIRDKDIDFLRSYKSYLGPRTQLMKNIQAESLNRSIRREMKRLGLSEKYEKTTLHAVRKTYARERMVEERSKGLSERESWEVVQKELGHGERFRQALYDAYIGH